MAPQSLRLACSYALFLLAASPADTAAQAPTPASILGIWHGTSMCVDKARFPACHDEEVIYEVRPAPQLPDSVILRADKVVDGAREFMGELVFGHGPGGEWSSVFPSQRSRSRWTVRVEGSRMTGTLIDLPSGRQVRALSLQRSAQ